MSIYIHIYIYAIMQAVILYAKTTILKMEKESPTVILKADFIIKTVS